MRLARPQLRFAPLWLGLGLFIVACIVLGSLLPQSEVPDLGFTDKFEHAFAYLLLSFWYASLVRRPMYPALIVALVLFGVGIELLQDRMHFGRQADPVDLLANAAGIVLGMLLAITPLALWADRAEAVLIRRGAA